MPFFFHLGGSFVSKTSAVHKELGLCFFFSVNSAVLIYFLLGLKWLQVPRFSIPFHWYNFRFLLSYTALMMMLHFLMLVNSVITLAYYINAFSLPLPRPKINAKFYWIFKCFKLVFYLIELGKFSILISTFGL